jgi:hypothetical protein
MHCDTKMALLKAFEDAVQRFDLADSKLDDSATPFEQRVEDVFSARINLSNARLAYVDHVAGCTICAADRLARAK